MSTPINPRDNQSTSLVNPQAPEETARLLLQDRALTQAMGGLLPADLSLEPLHLVLDLACGPGGWAGDLARSDPALEVVGVDSSERMVPSAQASARTQGIVNASFQVMDLLAPLEFPDDAFDLVNARLISSCVPAAGWPSLLQECLRITRPGGVVRMTEAEWLFSTGPASERFAELLLRAMWLAGQSFAPDGKRIGITVVLSQLLRDAGLEQLQQQASVLEYSFGTPAHEVMYDHLMMGYPLLLPFLLKWGVATQEELERLYQRIGEEMHDPAFRGLWFLLSVWGNKPHIA